jgi:hypothetical protein
VITRGKRSRSPRRRLDLTSMREALATGEAWVVLGRVESAEGGLHWDIYEDDLLIEVVTIPDEEPLTCRMGSIAGGSGIGIWSIPSEGTEVVIVVPRGDYTFSPCIVATLSSGGLPNGVAAGVTVVTNAQVLVHDGSGGAEPVITKSQYDAHSHSSGTGPTGVPNNTATSGTTVLKAK